MILLDTNVIIDLLGTEDHPEARWSRTTFNGQIAAEQFGCNLVVLAELAAEGAPAAVLLDQLNVFRIQVLDLELEGAFEAGRAFALYRKRGGSRSAILADFLIAGHAQSIGASLMTRNRRLGSYFPELTLITPDTHP